MRTPAHSKPRVTRRRRASYASLRSDPLLHRNAATSIMYLMVLPILIFVSFVNLRLAVSPRVETRHRRTSAQWRSAQATRPPGSALVRWLEMTGVTEYGHLANVEAIILAKGGDGAGD